MRSLSSCLRTKLKCLSGIKRDLRQPGKVKARQVCEMKGCELTKCAAVSASLLGFCFLLQTLEKCYGKHRGIPLDQWLARKATKINPLRTCMTAATCGLVTQTLQKGSQHSSLLMLGRINTRDD